MLVSEVHVNKGMSWDDDFLGARASRPHQAWHSLGFLSSCRGPHSLGAQIRYPSFLAGGDTIVSGSPVAAIAGRVLGIEPGNHFFSMFDALPPIGEEPGAEPAEMIRLTPPHG